MKPFSRQKEKCGLAIRAMVAAIPYKFQTISNDSTALGLTPMQAKMYGRLYGLDKLPFDADEALDALLKDAFDRLFDQAPEDVAQARYVIHCHTIPTVRQLSKDFGVQAPAEAEVMSLTMAHCASGLVALELLERILAPGETAVVLVGEKAFHPRVRVIKDNTVMSEGVVAVLVAAGQGQWPVLGTYTSCDGSLAISRGHPGEEPPLVDNYVGFVSQHISDAAKQFDISLSEVRLILPHNVNVISWMAIARSLGVPASTIYTRNIPRRGHCFGADPFLNLMDANTEAVLIPGDKVLCVSVGMGMTAATSLIEISHDTTSMWRSTSMVHFDTFMGELDAID